MLRKEVPVRSHSGEFRTTNKSNKKYLAEDFKHRCAYCDDLDSIYGGYNMYQVEHFAPKGKFPKLESTYENLLYSCPYCNSSKGDDWPSDEANTNVAGDEGYVDPCNAEYEDHLDRSDDGRIIHKTNLGKYMFIHLNLSLLRHSRIYNIDKIQNKCKELEEKINIDKSQGKNTIKKEEALNSLYKDFQKYYCQLQVEPNT